VARKKKFSELANAFVSMMGNGSAKNFPKPENPVLTLDVDKSAHVDGCDVNRRDGKFVLTPIDKRGGCK